jgi:DNA-binding transcriptional ArsR family regulator
MTYIKVLEALSDSTRRALFERLRKGPCTVGELVDAVPVSQPAVSQHLRVLRAAHLVKVQKNGARHIYSIDPRGLAELRRYVEGLWGDVLAAFQEYAQETKPKASEGDKK